MLYVTFRIGADRYALDVDQVEEVLPLVAIKSIPHAPRGVSGLFDYRGTAIPVVDLTELALGVPAPRRISTRILLVRAPGATSEHRRLGLIVEKATDVLRMEPSAFVEPGVRSAGAPWLGRVAKGPEGELVQHVDVRRLLPAAVLEALHAEAAED
jgi:chemotaxis-related protein WspB